MGKSHLPINITDSWHEIFDTLDIRTIPFEYMESLHIMFSDGQQMVLPVSSRIKKSSAAKIEAEISKLLSAIEDDIIDMDIKIDVKRVKKDISKKTKKFIKGKFK